jgi:nicotinamide-nucleotide amidase
MPASNRLQALFPSGSTVIPNPHGTAPGIELQWPGSECSSHVFALPGVPAEMFAMWSDTVRNRIADLVGSPQVVCHRCIKCFGVGESHLEAMLPDLIRRDREPRVGITVHGATISLRITTSGPDETTCRQQMQPTVDMIRECLGELVFGEESDELEDVVLRELASRGERLVCCEWGTDGLLAQWLGRANQNDPQLDAALVVTGRASLRQMMGSEPPFDNQALVAWMAEHARQRFGSDWSLAVGPRPDEGAEHAQIEMAVAGPRHTEVAERLYRGHPDILQSRAAKQALDLLRHALQADDAAGERRD